MALGSFISAHRSATYAVLSTALVGGVILNAFNKHSNFYSVAVYLSKSSGSVMALANFGLLLTLVFGNVCRMIFFGTLRPVETERLYDRMWFFVTESLLAFTLFREEFDGVFGLMFMVLLFLKCFHWILADRIDWMDQVPYPGPDRLFHARTWSLLGTLYFADLVFLLVCLEMLINQGYGWIVLFASEFAILLASNLNAWAKYGIACYDLFRARNRGGADAPVWEDKSMWTFYVELITDFLKLSVYLAFFSFVMTYYGLPLNVIRDVYITARSFISRVRDLIRYRSATRNMDKKYPDATKEELEAMSDRTCIICREEMVLPTADPASAPSEGFTPQKQDGPNETPKKLPCGHIFHFHCLRSWLERQQSCPTCRRSVLEAAPAATNPAQPAAPAPGGQPQNPNENNPPNGAALPPAAATPGPANTPAHGGRGGQPPAPRVFQGFHAGGQFIPWGYGQPEPTPVPTPTTKEPTPAAPTPDTDSPDTSGPTEQVSAREAARAAALRRLGGLNAPSTSNSAPPSTPVASSSKQPLAASSSKGSSTAARPSAPRLIPLFDPSAVSAQIARSMPLPYAAPVPYAGFPFVSPTPPIDFASPPTTLPPIATSSLEDQVLKSGQLTREVVEERLRMLEGVQSSIWKAVEDLTKISSILPSSSSIQPPPIEGKGKAKEIEAESDSTPS